MVPVLPADPVTRITFAPVRAREARPSAFSASNVSATRTCGWATGSLTSVALDSRAPSPDVASIGSDAMAPWYKGLLYVVNRFGGDNIQVIDPAQNYATVRQFSVGNGSNPQDIAFVSPTKA